MVANLSRKIFGIVAVTLLALVSLLAYDMKLGLDLQGGSRIVYRVDFEKAILQRQIGEEEDRYQILLQTADVFSRRVDALGLQEIPIYPQGTDEIVVELPGAEPQFVEQVKSTIVNQGSLRFRIVVGDQDDLQLAQEVDKFRKWREAHPGEKATAYNLVAERDGGPRAGIAWLDIAPEILEREKGGEPEVVRVPGGEDLAALPLRVESVIRGTAPDAPDSWDFTGADLSYVGPWQDEFGFPAVQFEFVEHRKAAFRDFTDEFTKRPMAIVLNDEVHNAPEIREALPGRGIITGGSQGFSPEEQRELITVLRTGSLKVQPELVSESYVGPSLGADSIRAGIYSFIAGGLLVFLFMVAYYRLNGAVACLSLIYNGFLLLGALSFTQATLTLPGLAGLVLTIGMAVDANILIYERVREERDRGREVMQAYKNGFERAFVTIVDSNLTTLISGLILYKVGTGPVRGFAVTLSLGILTTLFSVLVFSKVILHWLVFKKNPVIREIRMGRFLARQPSFSFLRWRWAAIGASTLLIAAGLVVFGTHWHELMGIDFVGGGMARVQLAQPTPIEEVRSRLGMDYGVTVSGASREEGGQAIGTLFLVRRKLDAELRAALEEGGGSSAAGELLEQDLRARLGGLLHSETPFPEITMVGERLSGQIQQKAIQALLLSLIAMVIYLNFRFKELRYGLAGVIALAHDVLFSLGAVSVYSVLRFGRAEINLETIAAFLTIIGYSINDTIVIFDRIRENLPRRKGTFAELIDLSVNQTLSRTMLTALTVFLTVLILFVANRSQHNALEGFSLAMLVGTVVGTYSTVYIASPALLFLDRWARHKLVEAPATAGQGPAAAPTAAS